MAAIVYDGRYIAYDSGWKSNATYTMEVAEIDFLGQKALMVISSKTKLYNAFMKLVSSPELTLSNINTFILKLTEHFHALIIPLDGTTYYSFDNGKSMRKRDRRTYYCFASDNVDDIFGYCAAKYKKDFALKVLEMSAIGQQSNLIDFDVAPPFTKIDTFKV